MIVMTTELVAWSSTKATTIAATADSRSGVWSSASALFCTAVAPVRRRIISAVVSTLRAPTTPITGRMAASPNAPMMNVASGGPATQANDTIARVFITSAISAPERRSSAKRRLTPTPAGPPRTVSATTASGSVVTVQSAPASATVSTAEISSGRR